MQTRPANWGSLFVAPHKTEYRFVINGVNYDGKNVHGTPEITKPLLDKPAIGRCCTGSLDVTVSPGTSVIPKAATVNAFCRLCSIDGKTVTTWVPQGKYYITSRSGNSHVRLTCCDNMIKAGQTYRDKSAITQWPAPMKTVVTEIAKIMGVSVDSRTVINTGKDYVVSYPNDDVLMSEVLGMIAAAHGGNWIITENGALRLIPFISPAISTGQNLSRTHSGFSLTGPAQMFTRVVLTDTAKNEFTSGDDTGLTLGVMCDYATQAMVEKICSVPTIYVNKDRLRVPSGSINKDCLRLSTGSASKGLLYFNNNSTLYGATYLPYELSGAYLDPLTELGDTVMVQDRNGKTYNVVVYSIKMGCTVAGTCTLIADAEDETEDEYPYYTMQDLAVSRTVRTDQTYFGNRITRSEGFVSELLVGDNVKARLTANASVFSMQSDDGKGNMIDRIYFDTKQGKYVITADVTINGVVTFTDLETGGSTVINGDNITTGTIKAARLDLSDYSTTTETGKQITSAIEGFSDGLALSVTDGDTSSTIELTLDGIILSSGSISFNGFVTFTDLEGAGTTTINGSNITTGTIDANDVNIINLSAASITSGQISTSFLDLSSYSTTDETETYVTKTISDTMDGLEFRVSSSVNGNETTSTITMYSGAVSITSTSIKGTTATQAASIAADAVNGITLEVSNNDTSSTLTLKAGATKLSSGTISFEGFVTFTDLETGGSTTISGDNITTGMIKAARLDLSDYSTTTETGKQITSAIEGFSDGLELSVTSSTLSDETTSKITLTSGRTTISTVSITGTTKAQVADIVADAVEGITLSHTTSSSSATLTLKAGTKSSSTTIDCVSESGASTIAANAVKGIKLSVTNNTDGTSSTIKLTGAGIDLGSANITFNGYVTFKNLSTVSTTTTINGGNITTGTIDASQVTIKNLNASNISTGTLSADRISGGTIDANKVTIKNLTASSLGTQWNFETLRIGGTNITIGDSSYIAQISFSRTGLKLAGDTTVGTGSDKIGFFGSSGSARKYVSTVSSTSDLSSVASGLNSLINALHSYGLV